MTSAASSLTAQALQLMSAERVEEALPLAEHAAAGLDAVAPAHGLWALALVRLGRRRDAQQAITQALTLNAGSADGYDSLAFSCVALSNHWQANTLYRRAVELEPGCARFWYNLATSERSLGQMEAAEGACDRALILDPTHYSSYLLRSELRVQTPARNHLDVLYAQLRAETDDRARMFLCYALGKELDDLGQYDEAFRSIHEGAQIRRRHLAYDVAADEHKLRRIAECFAGSRAGLRASADSFRFRDSSRFIFIVGLPRSGTTLVERILTGLKGVRTNGETENFSRALLAAAPASGTDVFARAAAVDADYVATGYAQLAGAHDSNECIIDKLPLNYLYIGAIRQALPEAKLIFVQRRPLDSCFGMYRILFGQGYPFSYDFKDLARYYAAHQRLMTHWRAQLADGLHEVQYEELVQAPAEVGARIARHCGLTWEVTALAIERNTTPSTTASAAQIRRPIYRSSVDHAERYARHLEPLADALMHNGVDIGSRI